MLASERQDGGMAWDWLAPVVTGVVGVVGIAGSVWTAASARRSQAEVLRDQVEAESRRAYLADKRVTYARLLSELTTYVHTSVQQKNHQPHAEANPEEVARYNQLLEENSGQMITVGQVIAEAELIAEPAVVELARELAAELLALAMEGEDGDRAGELLTALIQAMREDLHPGHGLLAPP
ncbi:hypothetical protein [Micromonospora sp. NPDC092111]|uniref:hypothetical protein n=1 Tax=Micromonospora sp. NPDC092111 TaxID=3364289 RepID=UPI00380CD997